MNRFGLLRWASAAALPCAIFVLLVAAPVSAQNNNNSERANTNTARVADRDDDTDWGWLGLLGLAGLAGLIPKKRAAVVVQDRDVNTNRR
jgi:MYXO-CTERM domain-containing protein